MPYGNWNGHMNGGYGWWILMTIMMVVFWGGLIWFAVTLIRHPRHTSDVVGSDIDTASVTKKSARKTALEILDKRLARGEIELDDYRQRRQALESPKE
jgi:putative membrane protein